MLTSLNVLFNVILKSSILISPVVPFITESIYQNLRKAIPKESKYQDESIHLLLIPEYNEKLIN